MTDRNISIPDYDNPGSILRSLVRVWNKPRGFPPQDVADLMEDLSVIVERARRLIDDPK